VNDMPSLVKLLQIHWRLGMTSGILIANPIPLEDEIPASQIEPAIAAALQEAKHKQMTGKTITPFLLNEVANATKGKSMLANINLIKHNVRVGAELALSI